MCENVNSAVDLINLPPFVNELPHARLNCGYQPKKPPQEMVHIDCRVEEMTTHERLIGTDLIVTFIVRRVLSLQHRVHKICEMSGRRDPCRMSTRELNPDQIAE